MRSIYMAKWWSLDTVFVLFRCKCGNCIVLSLQNINECYCCSKLYFAVSYSPPSEGHNCHILRWYSELQMDQIHVNHLRPLVFCQWFLLYFGRNSTCAGNSFRCFTLTTFAIFDYGSSHVAADPTSRLSAAFTVCKKILLVKTKNKQKR